MKKKTEKGFHYCAMPKTAVRKFEANVGPTRERLIRYLSKKWLNGTVLHYWFFDKPSMDDDGRGKKYRASGL